MKRETHAAPAAVGFVGSILFIITLIALWGTIGSWSVSAASAFWPTIIAGVAIIGTISLFIASIGNMRGSGMAAMAADRSSWIAGFAVIVLTLNNTLWLVVAVVAFILAYLGTAMSMSDMKMK
jgi:hypothetical protein